MSIAEQWRGVDITTFARSWLQEVRNGDDVADGVRQRVVLMSFTAPPEVEWAFVLSAVAGAQTESELCAIAAGPFEHLLGFHGEQFIDLVEEQGRENAAFARTTTAAAKYMMSDAVWGRVLAIHATVRDPL